MLTLDPSPIPDRVVTVRTDRGDEFQVTIRPPTVADELAGMFSTDPFTHRVARAVAAWSGVNGPDGHDVPYSPAALATLLRAFPECGPQLVAAVSPLYGGATEDDLGESDATRSDGSAPASVATSTT